MRFDVRDGAGIVARQAAFRMHGVGMRVGGIMHGIARVLVCVAGVAVLAAEPDSPELTIGQFVLPVVPGEPRVVQVDCPSGAGINEVLARAGGDATPLVIEIRGMCSERVAIERDDVTLRGLDPALDGIAGQVTIRYADNARIEDLGIRDGSGTGIDVWHSQVQLERSVVEGHDGDGMSVLGASHVVALDTAFVANGRSGVRARRGSLFVCLASRFEGNRSPFDAADSGDVIVFESQANGRFGPSSSLGGRLRVFDSSIIAESFGVSVYRGGWSDIRETTVSVTRSLGVVVGQEGHAELYDVSVGGDFRVDERGYILLFGVTQEANPTFNLITDGGQLDAWPLGVLPTTLVGPTSVTRFGTLLLNQSSRIDGNLSCARGGDALLDSGAEVTGQVVGCEHVEQP